MGRGTRVQRALQDLLELRSAAREATSAGQRERIERVALRRREELDESVPKARAAEALGVSVTALDRWIARGALPVVRRPGSSREEIEADALLDLAEEVSRLREAGRTRGLLAAAFERLDEARKPLPELRPNQSARELRQNYLRTTPADRLREVAELSRFQTDLALRGVAARQRQEPGT